MLLLASCGGRSIYKDAERAVPLTKITSSSFPFSSLMSQQSGGEIVLSPPDPKLNPDPVQVDFNPAAFFLTMLVRLSVGTGALALLRASR